MSTEANIFKIASQIHWPDVLLHISSNGVQKWRRGSLLYTKFTSWLQERNVRVREKDHVAFNPRIKVFFNIGKRVGIIGNVTV